MNIHVNDENLIKSLFDSMMVCIPFGSVVYGLETNASDKDFICIYSESNEEKNSFLWEHHNFQVKLNGNDYVFTTLKNFIRNLLNGDMPGNLEVIHQDEAKDGILSYLYDNRKEFYSYTNIRSFLGFVKRDLKHALKDNRRLVHAYRGIESAKMMIDGNLNVYCNQWDDYKYHLMRDIKNDRLSFNEKRKLVDELTVECDDLRNKLNIMLERNDIHRFLDIEKMKELDEWLLTRYKYECYNNNVSSDTANHLKYEILENGIKY